MKYCTENKILLKNEIQEEIIESIILNETSQITSENDLFLKKFSSILQIQSLEETSEIYEFARNRGSYFQCGRKYYKSFP